MRRSNGGFIGKRAIPTVTSGSGIWTPNDVMQNSNATSWPQYTYAIDV